MVPRLLRLRNFMSYGDEPVELDFTGLHFICLSGGNGNGKSALLDAVTWSLWGRSRARREDDLVAHGATEMQVELEFAAGAGVYRVLRKRTLRRGASTAGLELQARGEGGYASITGGTIAETQARLLDILKLDYETFINSTFLMQGRADEFTVKGPSDRKAVLAKILGLEEYERLSDRARERGRGLVTRAMSQRDAIAAEEGEVARRPALRIERVDVERERDAARVAVRATEKTLWDAQAERQRLEAEERALKGVQESIAAFARDVETLTKRRDDAAGVLRKAESLLRDEERITAGADELRRARAELDELGSRSARARAAERAVDVVRRELDAEAARLRAEGKAAVAEAERLGAVARGADLLRRQFDEATSVAARIPLVEAERGLLVERIAALRAEVAALQGENTYLEGDMKPLRERLKLLQEKGAACPVCGKGMSEEERNRIYAGFKDEGVSKKGQLDANAARIAAATGELAALQRQDRELETSLAVLRAGARDLTAVRGRLDDALAAAEGERVARARAGELRRVLDAKDFAPEAHAALAAATDAVLAVGYDPARRTALGARIDELTPLEALRAALETAHERRADALVRIAEVEGDLERRRRELDTATESAALLRVSLAVVPEIEARKAQAERALTEARADEARLNGRLAALDERLRDLDEREERLRERRAELARVEREGDAYAELGRMFGKAGIQALIIENATPELEGEANLILSRMSDNGMQVRFIMQRQGVKRDSDPIETLDIEIADANGTRPYEMFSGGEAFRVNFAIRVALSRLLAARAGARLQMLVVDEGFGTQDGPGRERLLEAIQSVADDFEQIIIITHIDELKDAFATRIDIVKGVEGSRIAITAA